MQLRKLNLDSKGEVQPPSERQWIGQFIELQLKELRQEKLTAEEASFLAHVELAGWAIPGALADAILEYGLPAVSDDVYRVAAASSTPLYDQVLETICDGMESFHLLVNGDAVAALRIDGAEGRVEPLYIDGYSYWVDRRGGQPELVGRFGGIFLTLEDLRGMIFIFDAPTKTIRLMPA